MRKARVIILEGADGAGKSTMADRLERDELRHWNAVHRIHNVPPRKGTTSDRLFDTYYSQIQLAVMRRPANVTTIIDRSYVSEWVYGPLFREQSLLTEKQIRKLEKLCKRHDIERIGVQADVGTRMRRLVIRGEDPGQFQAWVGDSYTTFFHDHTSWTIVDSTSADS